MSPVEYKITYKSTEPLIKYFPCIKKLIYSQTEIRLRYYGMLSSPLKRFHKRRVPISESLQIILKK